ncbi:MAG: hypothetical protein J1E40_04545 [Oscillospiraceae bacterium]|nr:hypothetical protein [Oscillospiraceae bacterium]
MKELKRRRRIDGTVLIMILTVMIVLIIMLAATLTVVTTANQRIYTKFEENQAYYSARSALDIFTDKMLADRDYYAYDGSSIRPYSYTNDSGATATANMKQGLGVQGEFYKIRSQGIETEKLVNTPGSGVTLAGGATAAEALGFVENIKEADGVFGGSTPEDKFFSVSDTAVNDDTIHPYDYILYKVWLPAMGNGSDNYGKIVDFDPPPPGKTQKDQLATIKVEVLDRVFNTNPTYSTVDMINIVQTGTAAEQQALKDAIKNGDRTKDHVRLRITSTVEFMGVEGTVVLLIDSDTPTRVSSSRAVTSLSDIDRGTSLHLVGGASSLTGTVSAQNEAMIVGDVFTAGNFVDGSNTHVHMIEPKAQVVSLGKVEFTNKNPVVSADGVVLYGYDGISTTQNQDFGSSSNNINIVTPGSFSWGSNEPKIYGNLYAGTVDFSWTGTNGNVRFFGETYTNNIIFNSNQLNIDDANLTLKFQNDFMLGVITNPFNVSSGMIGVDTDWDHIADRVFRVSGSGAEDVASGASYTLMNFPANLTFNTANVVNVDYFDGTNYTMTPEMKKKFTVPGSKLAGAAFTTNEFELPTMQDMYKDYFDPTKFFDEASNPGHGGEFNFTGGSIADMKNATDQANNGNTTPKENLQALFASEIMTSEDKYGGSIPDSSITSPVVIETKDAGETEIDASINQVISSNGYLESGHNYGLVAIDARSNNITIQLGDGVNMPVAWDGSKEFKFVGQFIIYGDKNVTFLLPGDPTGAEVKYSFGSTADSDRAVIADSRLVKVSEVTGSVNGANSSVALSLGSGGSSPAPNVDILAGENACISLGTQSFVTGYIYAPQSAFEIAGGANGLKYNFTYSGKTPSSGPIPTSFNVVGSVLCLRYKSAQSVGVCYIGRDAGGPDAGEPYLDWKPYRYQRY